MVVLTSRGVTNEEFKVDTVSFPVFEDFLIPTKNLRSIHFYGYLQCSNITFALAYT